MCIVIVEDLPVIAMWAWSCGVRRLPVPVLALGPVGWAVMNPVRRMCLQIMVGFESCLFGALVYCVCDCLPHCQW